MPFISFFKVKNAILQKHPGFELHLIAAASGIILHSMISGWDKRTCTKVHATLCHWNNIGSLVLQTSCQNTKLSNLKLSFLVVRVFEKPCLDNRERRKNSAPTHSLPLPRFLRVSRSLNLDRNRLWLFKIVATSGVGQTARPFVYAYSNRR